MTKQQSFKPLGRWLVAAFVSLGAAGAGAQAPARPPLEAFFQNPAFQGGQISPNGRYVAIGVASKGGRTQLLVLDVEKLTAKTVAAYADVDIGRFAWVNDERLIYNVGDRQIGAGDRTTGSGLQSVNRDGSDFRELFSRRYSPTVLGSNRAKGSDDIFVARPKTNLHHDVESIAITRMNARTGRSINFNQPGDTVRWWIDFKDVPRAAVTRDGLTAALHYLDAASEKWQKLAEWQRFSADGIEPLGITPDGTLYVAARNGRDKQALFRFDVANKALDPEPVVAIAGYDFAGELVMNNSKLLGFRYWSDGESTFWVDPEHKQVQAKVDVLLPGAINSLRVPVRPEVPYVLVYSYSDSDPGRHILYNTETGKLTLLGASMRDVEPKQMARRDLVRYKARDGMEIPAWLTLPRGGGKNLPLVVLVHDGPSARGGYWQWRSESQFLASRGYAVLEPEFRGSTGFGYQHYRAGLKQWGLAMQNDLADGARWAADQGIADNKRICIAGFAYGGYATLMGLATDPDIYRCGIGWSSMTDLEMMYSTSWSNYTLDMLNVVLPLTVGDPEKDAAQLKATSPLHQASRIKQPVLLAHGDADRLVPIVNSLKFRDTLKKTNPDVEWIEYTEEGHGWALVKNRVDFWTRVEKFLERNIGAKP
jgi:dipeptidyl aminopeptidase/acylaminoacyl peptidase